MNTSDEAICRVCRAELLPGYSICETCEDIESPWILCSDRLPSPEVRVLVLQRFKDTKKLPRVRITIGMLFQGQWTERKLVDTIAWAPLPAVPEGLT